MAVSNSARSADYKQRLEELRQNYELTAPFKRGMVVRRWLRSQLGCHASFLSTPKIKRFLKTWDLVRARKEASVEFGGNLIASDPSPKTMSLDEITSKRIHREQARKLRDVIEWGEARIGKYTRRCPRVTFDNDFQAEIYSWQCVRVRMDLPDSLWDSAKIILQFFRWLRRLRKKWREVDDDLILEFRESLRVKRTGKERINKIMGVIHSFYRHQERAGRLRYRVQIYAPDALPAEMLEYEFPIKSELRTNVSKRGVRTHSWSSPWLLKGKESSYGKKVTPTDPDLVTVHQNFHKRNHGTRNSLIFSAVEDSGGRVSEVLAARVWQLPNIDQFNQLLNSGGKWAIQVKRKGQDDQLGETAPLYFSVPVVMRMLSYASGPRADIIRKSGSPADHLFIKSNGQVPKSGTVSKLATKALREAGVHNSTIHKVRSKFIKDRIRERLATARAHAARIGPASNWTETILSGSAIDMNHKSPEALKPYIDDIFAEETANGGPQTLVDLETKIREAKLHIADIEARLATLVALNRIVAMVELSPRKDEILAQLCNRAEELLRAA
ncbi:hypothetical protein GCM10007919_40830 [Rhizobium indigoferae]|nr:hypothetical protein GCM10007919_40830 [Rhizobium indigoferae]